MKDKKSIEKIQQLANELNNLNNSLADENKKTYYDYDKVIRCLQEAKKSIATGVQENAKVEKINSLIAEISELNSTFSDKGIPQNYDTIIRNLKSAKEIIKETARDPEEEATFSYFFANVIYPLFYMIVAPTLLFLMVFVVFPSEGFDPKTEIRKTMEMLSNPIVIGILLIVFISVIITYVRELVKKKTPL